MMTTRFMEARDVPDALGLFDITLGDGYVSGEDLLGYAEGFSPDKGSFALVVTQDDDPSSFLGVATVDVVQGVEGLVGFAPVDMQEVFRSLVSGATGDEGAVGRCALLHSVAVSPHAQGKGVGSFLVREVMEVLSALGVGRVVSVGWTDDQGCHIEGVLTRNGFTSLGDVSGYWRQDSIVNGYDCPTCGNPCSCVARLFLGQVS